MGPRPIALAVALIAIAGCATAARSPKTRELTAAERDRASEALEPLLAAANLWHGPADGCAAVFSAVDGDVVGAAVTPHAPCRVRLVLTTGTLTRPDHALLRAMLSHEIAHMQLGHADALQARVDAKKQTEQGIKTASRAASKAVGFIPGIGGFISSGIGASRQVATAAIEMQGNPYLPEEESAADAMAVTLLNATEPLGCHALIALLEERQRAPDDQAWAPWVHVHPVSAARVEAIRAVCSDPTAR
jgi:Zn-dependent protease with chaperone function